MGLTTTGPDFAWLMLGYWLFLGMFMEMRPVMVRVLTCFPGAIQTARRIRGARAVRRARRIAAADAAYEAALGEGK